MGIPRSAAELEELLITKEQALRARRFRIPFASLSALEIEELVARKEKASAVKKWALYVARGPKRLRNGRSTHAGPTAPYSGVLFLRLGDPIGDEREQTLRDEVNEHGTHNVAVRFARTKQVRQAVRLALLA